LKQAAAEGRLRFLFVHPLSASGRILPEHALRQAGINPNTNEVTWTCDHAQTVRELRGPDEGGRLKVGFVWDDIKDAGGLRRLPLPGLDEEWLPQEVALLHPNFESHKEELVRVFLADQYPTKYVRVGGWVEEYRKVADWLPREGARQAADQQFVTLAQIVGKLNSYENGKGPGATRLALVLSGGGAKCAYQLGAINALENQLEKLKGEDGQRKIDVGLVVGTSGGAINALTTALGVTRTGEGQEALGRVWAGFDQRDFFRPWEPVPTFFALGFGLMTVLLVIVCVRSFGRERADWWVWSGVLILGLAVLELSIWAAGWTPWELLKWFGLRGWAYSHSLHHFWLLANLNCLARGAPAPGLRVRAAGGRPQAARARPRVDSLPPPAAQIPLAGRRPRGGGPRPPVPLLRQDSLGFGRHRAGFRARPARPHQQAHARPDRAEYGRERRPLADAPARGGAPDHGAGRVAARPRHHGRAALRGRRGRRRRAVARPSPPPAALRRDGVVCPPSVSGRRC
jgi:hypothetical protein